jgi:hypothetical protein
MRDQKHILRRFRWPVAGIIGLVIGSLLSDTCESSSCLDSTDGIVRIIFYFVGGICIGAIVTTERCIRYFLALLIGAPIGALLGGVAYLLFHAFGLITDGRENGAFVITVSMLAGAAIIGAHYLVSVSSWFGKRCPACSVRGSLSDYDSNKQFLGSHLTSINGKYFSYNKYLITKTYLCEKCGHSWNTTSESTEWA